LVFLGLLEISGVCLSSLSQFGFVDSILFGGGSYSRGLRICPLCLGARLLFGGGSRSRGFRTCPLCLGTLRCGSLALCFAFGFQCLTFCFSLLGWLAFGLDLLIRLWNLGASVRPEYVGKGNDKHKDYSGANA